MISFRRAVHALFADTAKDYSADGAIATALASKQSTLTAGTGITISSDSTITGTVVNSLAITSADSNLSVISRSYYDQNFVYFDFYFINSAQDYAVGTAYQIGTLNPAIGIVNGTTHFVGGQVDYNPGVLPMFYVSNGLLYVVFTGTAYAKGSVCRVNAVIRRS